MSLTQKVNLTIGGKWALSWKVSAIALPLLILIVPLTEGAFFSWWAFWRWTLVSIVTLIPLAIIYLIADVTVFKDRARNPVPGYYLFILGFILGAVRGLSAALLANQFNILVIENSSLTFTIILRAFNTGLIAMVGIPIISLISASIEIYQTDRNALIAERMFFESQKSESSAVIKSLRSSMTRKVDDNLLKVIQESQEYLDEKGRSLEANWELLAVKLRKSALDTIRPFSHSLHRRGVEKNYAVTTKELMRYVAHSIRIEIPWIITIYIVSDFKYIFLNSTITNGFLNILLRIVVIYLGLTVITELKKRGNIKGLPTYFTALFIFGMLFTWITYILSNFLSLKHDGFVYHFIDALWLVLCILLIGLISAFMYGQRAESAFLERQISKEQLETMILKREEERLSRELAKYLHGTIQSRLMASAMALEKAGRKGDKKALERELAEAYKSLRVPSAAYFSAPEATFKEEIHKVISKWADLMKVKLKIAPSIPEIPAHKSQEIGNVINEGLSNSFRHGSATQVLISITGTSEHIFIEVTDNGTGLAAGKPGLGTEWFKAIAGNAWILKSAKDSQGTILELSVKIL
jgi:signal transduction histidine kinase